MRTRTSWAGRSPVTAGLLVLVALASACGGPSYYPLDERYSWTYRITFESDDPNLQQRPLEGAVRNLPSEPFDGITTTTQVSSVGTSHSLRILAESGAGVRIVAEQGIKDDEPQRRASPQYILRYPVKVGTEWIDEGEPRFVKGAYLIPGVSRITGFETVTVGAGVYADAAKVVFEGSEQLMLGEDAGLDIGIRATSWFAPRVGLVRYEQIDTVADQPALSGRFVIELVGFRQL